MAKSGDIAPMQEYYGAMNGARLSSGNASTENSGVHIGKNVSIGKNVKIGGKPVTTKPDSPTN